ncbi:MAG: dihydrodipicolinate reductase [Rickettsiaceae bacterium]|jgi:4-hydroxy-tetrahydrodipicolinate reductase|nr:dihydrodipicolinate reductase [Rickettsiaceae bacterium]
MKEKIMIGVHGATGRMGKQVINLVPKDSELELCSQYARSGNYDSLENLCKLSKVIVDFSLPAALPTLLEMAVKYNSKLVIGTTGLTKELHNAIKEASKSIPVLYSANMSFGINLLNKILNIASSLIPKEEFDAVILDMHHKFKKDSPSGTALMLGNTINKVWNGSQDFADIKTNDPAHCGNISFSSVKLGNIVGEHSVTFANFEERIIFSHIAENRAVFARGAIKAAKWLYNKPKGLYSLQDTIEL